MNKTLYAIFKTFFKIGAMLLGGGYVILPLLQTELVTKKGWLSNKELCEYYAIAQSVPGIIAVNTSIFTGYKLKGQLGALAATFGIVLPAFLAIILIASMLQEVMQFSFIESIFYGIGIGVIMLLLISIREMWNHSIIDKFSCAIFICAFILSSCFKINPIIIIIAAILLGIIYKRKHPQIIEDEQIGEEI